MSCLTGLRCAKCGTEYPIQMMPRGCPACPPDKPSGVVCTYDYDEIEKVFSRELLQERPPTMWRYKEFLPPDEENTVSMGEGMTPLVKCESLGGELGLRNLYVKDESRNPTWSFKDRLASSSVSMALQFGAPGITASSSGNHGAATAAYAAKAGLDCVLFTVEAFPMTMRTLMGVFGAKVIAAPSPRDRWRLQELLVDRCGWYSNGNFVYPPVGYGAYGVDGYKTIAYEVCEQLGWRAPDKMVFPVGHGGSLIGAWRGFEEFYEFGFVDTKPQMIAAEPFGPLKNALLKGLDHVEPVPAGWTVAFSTGVDISTYQALKVLLDSQGIAETASDDEIMAMQLRLASREGIYGETAGVLTLAVIKKLVELGQIDGDETVVALVTSGGLKDPSTTQEYLPPIPLVEPDLHALRRGLEEAYGYVLPGE